MCLNPLEIPPVYVLFHLFEIELQELNFVPLKNVRQGKLIAVAYNLRTY